MCHELSKRWRALIRTDYHRLQATLLTVLGLLVSVSSAWAEAIEPGPQDGIAYPVGRIELSYAKFHEDHPALEEMQAAQVRLLRTESGFVAPRKGEPGETLRIDQIASDGDVVLYGSAIRQVDEALVDALNAKGLVGVLVRPSEEDVDPASSRDERAGGNSTLRLTIWTGRLSEYRTFASGSRVSEDERIDHPAHERIKKNSPAQPGDLLDKEDLEQYVAKLNRHPGRNVDVAFSTAQEPGGVYLDYLVSESRPWSAYAQLSNTGTESTTKLRERFGFTHNQLTGNDDILRIDYITGDFDSLNAVFGSYKIPFGLRFLFPDSIPDIMTIGVDGSWANYDAADVGFQTSSFKGSQWDVGGEWSLNGYQGRNLYVDFALAANYQHVEVDNLIGIFAQNGTANFFFLEPAVRLRYEAETVYFNANLWGAFNLADVAGTKTADLDNGQMGRSDVTATHTRVARWETELSFFLEPLLDPEGYNNPATPNTSTLAHEIFLRNWGQYSGDRLIPQHERIAGGLRTVRGYPQAFIAGDTVVISRGEYRLHIPRLLPINPDPIELPLIGKFRLFPQQVFGAPDWDLILRAFIDAAQVRQVDIQIGEENVDVIGLGLGLELQVKSNFIARFDWGNARTATADVAKGRNEFYFSVTLIF